MYHGVQYRGTTATIPSQTPHLPPRNLVAMSGQLCAVGRMRSGTETYVQSYDLSLNEPLIEPRGWASAEVLSCTAHFFHPSQSGTIGAKRWLGLGTLSIRYTYLSVCMQYVHTVLHENWTEWTENWYTNYVECWDPTPIASLAAMQIVGLGSENVRWGHENSFKSTSTVKY